MAFKIESKQEFRNWVVANCNHIFQGTALPEKDWPIVADWFYPRIFEEVCERKPFLIDKVKTYLLGEYPDARTEFHELVTLMIQLTRICNGMGHDEALLFTMKQLDFYNGRFTNGDNLYSTFKVGFITPV